MNIDEIEFMLANLETKLEHQKHVVTILTLKQKNHNRCDALLLKTAKGRLDKIKTDIEFLHVLKKQIEMGVEDDQWLLDSPVYLSTIQKMRLKYASLIEKAARL